MATRFETLIAQLKTTLEADADITVGEVHKQRVGAFNDTELPAYNITYGPDEPIGEFGFENLNVIDWDFVVFIDLYERSSLADIDGVFQDMRRNVHRAIMGVAPSQGLTFVQMTIPQGADEPITDDAGEKKNMIYRTNWVFRLRTSVASLET